MRAPTDTIFAPAFPRNLEWINTAPLRMDKQTGRPVLIEFWDFCRVNSLRTLPYLKEWHRRYETLGLRIIGVHTGGFPPSQDLDEIRAAVERLGIEYSIVVDSELEIWNLYGNKGWPARYLWTPRGTLHSVHYGEGAYTETELEIQAMLEVEQPMVEALRREDRPDAMLATQTDDRLGPYSGPYEAGEVWGVFDGVGTALVNGSEIEIASAGCHLLVEHQRNTKGELELEIGPGLTCYATCFTPGVNAPAPQAAGEYQRTGSNH